ncbi:MAG: GYD domain-containing protein [Candidatus Acidiferrales bacterium]
MPKYLIAASYTAEGVKGLLKDGGSARKAAVEAALKSIGGKLESFYFTFGDTDAFAIVEAPDNATAAALALATGAAGLVRTKTTVLITPEEMDSATKKNVAYRAPGK